jgi:predicted nucleotidyltransferase
MKEELFNLIQEKSPGAKPLLLVIRGSHAYGTNIETSDTDFSGVFIQSMDDILGFNYIDQINDDKNDTVLYELKRFIDLLSSNNPNILELLNTPEDCIIYKHPIFNEILNNRDKFITKLCAKSFGGYAVQQIQKAKGQNKKQNWEKERVTRKDVLDFVYVIEGEKSIPWKVWCIEKPQYGKEYIKYETKFCGIVNVPHAKDLYAVYHDEAAQNCFSENISKEDRENNKKYYDEPYSFGYKGLVKTGEGNNVAESNALRLSSIPKGETPICNIFYNKDGYSQHCREYKEYEEWLEKRNTQRWVDVESHGQKIDGKNMMHCKRLTQMSKEIAQGLGINVRRPDAESLIDIRKGKIDLETLINDVENEIIEIDELFKKSTLPDKVDKIFVNELLIKIRKNIYNI